MIAKAQKSSKLLASYTTKVQDLIKNYSPEYENEIKEEYYKTASYFHRYQKGVVKVSRWKFDEERKTPLILEKHALEVLSEKNFYEYNQDDDDDTRFFWVNFADINLFDYDATDTFGQSERQTLEHPLLVALRNNLEILDNEDFTCVTEENKIPTPFVFENIPQWIQVCGKQLHTGFEIIQKDKKNNIIAMTAPYGGNGEYTKNQISYLLKTSLVAYSGACRQTYLSRRTQIVIHTGNWGCGNCGNNNELIYLIQILAASYTGVSSIIFHDIDEKALNEAKKKYSYIQDKISMKKLIKYLIEQKYCWQRDEIKEELEKLGLHYGMTEEELKLWAKRMKNL